MSEDKKPDDPKKLKNKNNLKNNQEAPVTCAFPRDKFNSQAARQWMKNQGGKGQEKNLSANKRTLLRLFGAKKP
ncbi:MAG: hypothetical protein D5R97_03815 [Candidatus Syntrophonatronum acetioxidans]|uniref:Uncharacterized protein n=1 Tax=Candidatus Syntrophonatronum acetioxidans TaxID=1795816 RepID=A0A424YFS2_9FIRM|nr:MAG: hypothetical protein D5R97_03815 [Candidatus Syntrophonatronum acetioxidans]